MQRFFISQKGFTIFETLLVIAIVGIIVAVSIGIVPQLRDRASLKSGEQMVVQTLEDARNRSVTGAGEEMHGVHFETDAISIFDGNSYIPAASTRRILSVPVTTNHASTTIIFSRITGLSNTSATITLSIPSGKTSKIFIGYDGTIKIQ